MSDKADGHTIAVLSQLVASGYFGFLRNVELHNSKTVNFVISQDGLDALVRDAAPDNPTARFVSGPPSLYHRDVGPNPVEFRSFNGTFGKGSLQIVISRTTLAGYSDVDKHNPYNDVVRFIGHTGEVLGALFRRRHT